MLYSAIWSLLFVAGVGADPAGFDLLRTKVPIVDVVVMDEHRLRLYSQSFEAYDVTDSSVGWTNVRPVIDSQGMSLQIRRIGRVYHWDSLVVIGGRISIRLGDREVAALLRSTNRGESFSVVAVGSDTLAMTDDIRGTGPGHLFFLDVVGRRWTSRDGGMTWTDANMSGTVEIDMVKPEMGVAIDRARKVTFTVTNWQKNIEAIPSDRKITRKQPQVNKDQFWDRELIFWDSYLILRVGAELYRTKSNDLFWTRWDSVTTCAISRDRRTMVFQDLSGAVYRCTSFAQTPERLASGMLQAQFLRADDGIVIVMRADTGPIILHNGQQKMLRPIDRSRQIVHVDHRDESAAVSTWGVLHDGTGSAVFDIVKRNGNLWRRDTTLLIGPVTKIVEAGKDSLHVICGSREYVYDHRKRAITPFVYQNPLATLGTSPVFRFKVRINLKSNDGISTTWAEFRRSGNDFKCSEIVDSTGHGIRSKLISRTVAAASVSDLLKNIDERGNRPIDVAAITRASIESSQLMKQLDTMFLADEFFDEGRGYEQPPDRTTQIEDCKQFFAQSIDQMKVVNSEYVEQAIQAWRWSQNEQHVTFSITFENQSGKTVKIESAAANGSYTPGMLSWQVTHDVHSWRMYSSNVPVFLRTVLPDEVLGSRFISMTEMLWVYAALGAYEDGRRNGRWHIWHSHK